MPEAKCNNCIKLVKKLKITPCINGIDVVRGQKDTRWVYCCTFQILDDESQTDPNEILCWIELYTIINWMKQGSFLLLVHVFIGSVSEKCVLRIIAVSQKAVFHSSADRMKQETSQELAYEYFLERTQL